MPRRPARPCKCMTCSNTTEHASGYCEEHRKKEYQKIVYRRPDEEHHLFYYGKQWRAISRQKRDLNPFCERCFDKQQLKKADLVHHIIPILDGGQPFDLNNLQSLCYACHNQIHSIKTNH